MSPAASRAPVKFPPPLPPLPRPAEAPLTALVVEDDVDTCVLVRETLHMNGFFTVGTASAEEAVRFLNSIRFDCILLDWRLNGETGEPVVDAAQVHGKTPVIVMTASMQDVHPPVDARLAKPFSLDELVACAAEHARRSRSAQSR